ncbi:MAG: hypothetical protein ACJA0Q_002094 [Saprospiraceae bacterium]|jgi:hypothetical protein
MLPTTRVCIVKQKSYFYIMNDTNNQAGSIDTVNENEVAVIGPNTIMWKEGSTYDVATTNEQFDKLEKLLQQFDEKVMYLIDLSKAARPTAEIMDLIAARVKPLADKFEYVAVYTGKNYLLHIGIKFYFIQFEFNEYSSHTSLTGALATFKR